MKFLKVLMQVIAAIWGIGFVIVFPLMMLISPEPTRGLPAYVPLLWLITAVIGFVVPCFLIKLKFYKIAIGLVSAGTVSLFIVHASLTNAVSGFGWFYMPLLLETVIIITIAVLNFRKKQHAKDNAPAPSIFGGNKKGEKK